MSSKLEVAKLVVEGLSPKDKIILRDVLRGGDVLVRQSHPLVLLLTQAEAGRLLGCSRHTIKRLVGDGLLHPVRLRGALRYRRGELLVLAGEGPQ